MFTGIILEYTNHCVFEKCFKQIRIQYFAFEVGICFHVCSAVDSNQNMKTVLKVVELTFFPSCNTNKVYIDFLKCKTPVFFPLRVYFILSIGSIHNIVIHRFVPETKHLQEAASSYFRQTALHPNINVCRQKYCRFDI